MKPLALFSIFTLVAFSSLPARAQEDASFAGFQLNRSLPGARSLALGGAFVALADDATAAFANPAGLGQLERPEVSLETRRWKTLTEHTDQGRIGFPGEADLFASGEAVSDTTSLSFASFVLASPERSWALGLYRHQVAELSLAFESRGVRSPGSPPLFGPYTFSTDFDVVSTGLSASWALGDRILVGVGLAHHEFRILSIERVFEDPPPGEAPDFSGPIVARAGKEGEDEDWAGNLGILVDLGPRLTLGAAYRQGAVFAMREFFQGFYDVDSDLRLPDQWALGLAVRPTDRITISLQYDRVEYSSLLEGNRFELDFDGRFVLEDAEEIRFGLEVDFALGSGRLLTLAAGGWYDPDHTIVFEGDGTSTSSLFRRAYFRDVGQDQVHASLGAGLTWGKLQVNAAIDLADRIDTTALSLVYWF